MKNDRVKWLDVGKGIGIILVVLGHSLTSSIRNQSEVAMFFYNLIYFVHMPFLFCLSGYGFGLGRKRYQNMDALAFLKKKGKAFLLPYVVYSFLIYIFFTIFNYLPKVSPIIKKAGYGTISPIMWIKGLLLGDNTYSLHLWFLYSLFVYMVITLLLEKLWTKKYLTMGLAFVFLLLLRIIPFNGYIALPNLLYFYIWFVIGSVSSFETITKKKTIGCLMIVVLYLSLRNKIPFLNTESGLVYLLTILIKGVAVFALIGVAKWISRWKAKVLTYIGQHTFSIYLFHQPFWGSCYGSFLFGVLGVSILFVIVTSVLLSFMVPLCMGIFLEKTRRMKYLFGISR